MNISEKMETELNKQIKAEFYSAYLYQAMSAWFETQNLSGFAHWMQMQAKEEWEHGMKFYKYILERGGTIKLQQLEAPPMKWKSPLAVFKDSYAHEQEVTDRIERLMDLAKKSKDYATESMLKWFIDEQVEEEAQALEIVEKLKLIGDNTNGIFMMDSFLGKRKGD
jgi:ferritin